MLKEVLIKKATAVHGDKYDYSLVPDEFKSKDKLAFVCKSHGIFTQSYDNHVNNKRGCPSCGSESRSSSNTIPLAQVELEIKAKFPDLIFTIDDYVGRSSKVHYHCDIHGPQTKNIRCLLLAARNPCTSCTKQSVADDKLISKEDFIARSIVAQKASYDYSKVELVDMQTPVVIGCAIHGDFLQLPSVHMRGHSCKQCSIAARVKDVKPTPVKKVRNVRQPDSTTEQFVEQVQKIHPLFDFSKSVYTGSTRHVEVTCDKGHTFTARPANLKQGYGCKQCFLDRAGLEKRKGRDYYIQKAIDFHGDTYDYSLADFEICTEKTTVVCREHGPFRTTIDNHMRGKGCPKCAKCGFQSDKPAYFYILKVTDDVGKFGITGDMERRLRDISRNSCFGINILHHFFYEDGSIAKKIESDVLQSDICIGVVSRADMKQGFSETFYLKDISTVFSIIDNYTPA